MWTHLQPYLPNDQRASTIKRKARIGLWRAINLRRLIVLAGSGVTSGLGQMSWNRILVEFIALSLAEFSKAVSSKNNKSDGGVFSRAPIQQIGLFNQIVELCGLEKIEFFELASVDEPDKIIRDRLIEQEAEGKIRNDQLRTAIDLCEELLRVLDEDQTVPKHFPNVRAEFAKVFCSKPKDHNSTDSLFMDPIDAILTHTHSRRVLTTNYDAEFERFLFDRWLVSEPQTLAHEQFDKLSEEQQGERSEESDEQSAHERPKYPRKITVESPLRRGIVSTSIDAANVGDLINFASFSRSEEYQVFHLHGRLDRPQEMVVTRRDYRRIYAQDPSSAEAFRAAQEILFTGNDVLMIGFGGENDILLPFRRFVAQGRMSDQAPRRTFALMPSAHGEDYKRENANNAIHWAMDYDIYTVHYGGKRFRETLGALKSIKGRIAKAAAAGAVDRDEILPGVLLEAVKAHRIREKYYDSRGERALFGQERFDQLADLVATQPKPGADPGMVGAWCGKALYVVGLATTETYSNAMIFELMELDRLSRDWWDAWRHAPYERRARYHVAGSEIGGAPGYLSVRHCSIWEPVLLRNPPESWPPLVAARNTASELREKEPGRRRRILRFTTPRGTGQATFSNLLHHQQNQKFVFGLGKAEQHMGAFLAHLSFSMEFNSVLKAFSRFFCYWIAKSLERPPHDGDLAREMMDRRKALLQRHQKQLGEARLLLTPGSGLATRSLADFERVRRLAKDLRLPYATRAELLEHLRDPQLFNRLRLSTQDLDAAARELVAVAWEDDQNLLDQETLLALDTPELIPGPSPDEPSTTTVQRRHRLDMLREAMADYSSVAGDRRLFVCLSGLDRIADSRGDAYNPAHRAFFRLLSEREERDDPDDYLRTALSQVPLDIVLVAGRPDSPIAYLSEEYDPTRDKREGEPPRKHPRSGDFQKYAKRSATGRLLHRWTELPYMGWDQRIAMLNVQPTAADDAYAEKTEAKYQLNPRIEDRQDEELPTKEQAAAIFLRWAKSTRSDFSHRGLDDLHESSHIHRLLWDNLSLSLWVMRLWVFQAHEVKDYGSSPVPRGFHAFLRDLDAAAARDGFNGVVQYMLTRYEWVDRQRHDAKSKNGRYGEKTYIPELYAIIMRHLVLFALPVEPWVLIGCPIIQGILKKEYDRRSEELDPLPTPNASERTDGNFRQAYLARLEWFERVFMLRELQLALDELVGRALIMRVQPAADALQRGGTSEALRPVPETFLHQRYSLHNRMRQHIAHIIRLGVHDGADINHHRMSIYCDQPRELPSPSHQHFELVRDIVEYQIDHCRDTLASMFQLGHERRRVKDIMDGWDTETGEENRDPDQEDESEIAGAIDTTETEDKFAKYAAARRIFALDPKGTNQLAELHEALNARAEKLGLKDWDAPDGLGGSLGRLHAVPQRLRAMLSVLQGSFAIGSLSRMTHMREVLSEEGQTPFDAYRGWLRSLLNAGASLDRTQSEFERLFAGCTFQDGTGAATEPSGWLTAQPSDDISGSAKVRIAAGERRIRKAARDLKLGRVQRSAHKSLRHPFYRDEIAWLYNERGLAALTQGLVFDALPLLRQAAFIMSHRRVPESDSHAFHAAERRIRLNYGIALLERGKIGEAQRVLGELHTGSMSIRRSTPSEIKSFSELYLAICDHLGGSFHRAETKYEELHRIFSDKNQFRAVAITCRSHADLCRVRNEIQKGLTLADLSIKAASRSEQRDVEHLGMVSKARLLISDNQRKDAMLLLDQSLIYARQMGLMRIEIDAKIAMSVLMNSQGDYSLAGQFASEAAARSVRCGLRLRKLSSLMAYADSRRARGSTEFSKRLHRKIAREAEEVGYMTIAGLATSELSQ